MSSPRRTYSIITYPCLSAVFASFQSRVISKCRLSFSPADAGIPAHRIRYKKTTIGITFFIAALRCSRVILSLPVNFFPGVGGGCIPLRQLPEELSGWRLLFCRNRFRLSYLRNFLAQ